MQAPVEDYIQSFVTQSLKNADFKIQQLAGDASNRRYYRILHGSDSWVLMRWEPFDAKNYPFLSVLNHFAKHKIRVPKVIGMDGGAGLVLLEDLGDLTLERKFWESQSPITSLTYYKQAIDELIKIHFPASLDKTDCTAFKVEFDVEKLLWEMNYGYENLIAGVCNFKLDGKPLQDLTNVFTEICARLHAEPKTIAHRDYHSRNLMLKLDQMRVIDFQDARLGPIQYDLVSLLRDSYVNMSDPMVAALLDYYLDSAKKYLPKDFSREHFDEIFEVQTIQRCFKACGSFSSFYHQRGDTRYLKYISPTLKRVMKSLTGFPEYKLFADVLIDSGCLERKYEAL
jgi:N-acetylmuramate 1-kinase